MKIAERAVCIGDEEHIRKVAAYHYAAAARRW
jgi:hypothetical protein